MELKQVSIKIDHGLVTTMDPERRIIKDGTVVIDGNAIVDVGKTAAISARYVAARTIDARGKIVMPGLIDPHVHNVHTLSRGIGDDVDLMPLIFKRLYPYEAELTDEDTYWSAMLTCVECIRTGTTTIGDPCGYRLDNAGRAYEETGIRGTISWGGMDRWSEDRPLPDKFPGKTSTDAMLARMEKLVADWRNAAGGRIRGTYAIRIPSNASDELLKGAKVLADRDGSFVNFHVADHPAQVEWVKRKTGRGIIAHMADIGVLGPNWLFHHMSRADESEARLVREAGASVVHCPGSTLHSTYGAVSHGKFPEMIALGINVAIGCDSAMCNNSLDMFREMYHVATVHKEMRQIPDLIKPEEALEMATVRAAKALMWEDEIGSLEPGKKADLIVVDHRRPNLVPMHDFSIVSNLVYSGSGDDVETSIIDGKIVMENREILTVDVDRILRMAQKAAEGVLGRVPIEIKPRWNVT